MRCLFSSIAATLGMLATPSAVAAKEAEVVTLEPSSNWHMDYAADKCRLGRTFGSGKNKHVLFFEQHGPGTNFGFTIAGPTFSKFKGRKETTVQFGDQADAQTATGFRGELGSFGPALIFSSIWLTDPGISATEGDISQKMGVPSIDISDVGKRDNVAVAQGKQFVRLLTGELSKPLAALNTCSEDLVRAWGFDPEQQKRRAKGPVWTNVMNITKRIQQKYPADAVRAGEQGIFKMRVTIDANGKVGECVLLDATEQDKLKSPACKIVMRHAKFEPALDTEGEPMQSYYTASITYQVG